MNASHALTGTMTRVTSRFLRTAGLLGLFCFSAASYGAVATFDSGLEAWGQTSGISWESSGGNSGGYARFTDPPNGPATGGQFLAPNTFHGNWLTQYGANGIFSIDYKLFSAGTLAPFFPMWVQVTGAAGILVNYLPGSYTSPFEWTTFSRSLGEANWILATGTWEGALSDVTEVRVYMASASSPDEISGVDNIRVVSAAASAANFNPVPEPGTLLLLATGGAFAALRRRKRPVQVTA